MRRMAPALLVLLLAVPRAAHGEATLEVAGTVVATAPRLELRVVVSNRGDRAAAPLEITGELLGERRVARLLTVPAGGSGAVILDFAAAAPRPGVYAVTLLMEHPIAGTPDAAGNPPLASRRAWLLVALGSNADPAVRLDPQPLRLDVSGRLDVRVSSADGAQHRVRVKALPARGLRAEGEGALLDIPGHGTAVASLPIVRAGAPRGTRHAVLVVAEAVDGPVARTSVTSANVEIATDRSLFARWRRVVLAFALLLLAITLGAEAWIRYRRRT